MTTTDDELTGDLAYDPGDFKSDLETIAQEVTDEAAPETRLVHPLRPAYTLVFSSEIDAKVVERYTKLATKRGRRDARIMNGLVVGNHCLRIERNGEPITDSAGNQVDFGNVEFHEVLGVRTRADAAAKFLGGDGRLASMAAKVMQKAGYGEEIEEEDRTDPTGRG